MTKIVVLTDFIHGKAIFKLPKLISKNIQTKVKLFSIKKKNINPDLVKIYWGTRINDKILNKYKNLDWVHFGSIGTDKLSYDYLKNKKIKVTNSKGTNTNAMTRLILMYLLDTEKKILGLDNKSSRNQYEDRILNHSELKNNKILVLGLGNISKKIGLFKLNLHLDINYYSSRANNLKLKNVHNYNRMMSKIKKYKIIINLLKYNIKNKEFMNAKFFKKLNKNVKLILVGRIETINLIELINFLKSNKQSFAYIDAKANFKNIKYFNKLKKLKNVFLTPHIGGYYNEYWDSQFQLFNQNLKKYLHRKKLINIVKINKENFL